VKLVPPLIVTILLIGTFALIFQQDAEAAIKPIKLGIKFHGDPQICFFSEDENFILIGKISILDWQTNLKSFSQNEEGWNVLINENPKKNSDCNIEIHFLPKPNEEDTRLLKPQGRTIFEESRAVIEVYTTQYYDESAIRYEKDRSNRLRPVPYEYADVSHELLGKVTRHELGHVFGLKHQKNDSIMIMGPTLAEITDKDLKNVLKKYGKNGWLD